MLSQAAFWALYLLLKYNSRIIHFLTEFGNNITVFICMNLDGTYGVKIVFTSYYNYKSLILLILYLSKDIVYFLSIP